MDRQTQRRASVVALASGLLAAALWRHPPAAGGQAAESLSRPGHEDLTFWANHNGLSEIDVEGEVGFGDMGRLLMRRRANSDRIRALRDRFVFKVRKMAALDTPDLFVAEVQAGRLRWRRRPESVVVAAGRIYNLPLVLVNLDGETRTVECGIGGRSISARLEAQAEGGYLLKVVETQAGVGQRKLLCRSGEETVEAAVALDARALSRLRVRLRDDKGQPAAARVYLTAADGLAYAPPGTIARYASESAEPYFHAENFFEVDLPAGDTLVEATRGLEYELARQRARLLPGQQQEITLELKRWSHMASRGWYSSDAHIHANYTAEDHQVITPADVRLQTLAEDLNNANMMVANSSGGFLHDTAFFEGRPSALSLPGYIIYWNEEMRNAGMYGHMCFFNLKTLVEPLYTGFRNTPHWEDYPPNHHTAAEAQRQGGAVTYAHPGYQATLEGASCRELPVDLALGQVDAMDVLSNNPEEVAMELWYRLLNCGMRLAVSAGTDAFTNVADHYTPGGGRVYAYVSGPLRYQAWIDSYKKGRSFASNGPMLEFTVNGKPPGEEIRLPAGEHKVRVKAAVVSRVPVGKVEVVMNGKTVLERTGGSIDADVALEKSSWLALRATGPYHRLVLNDAHVFAHTSPVYVYLGDQPIRSRQDAEFWVDWIEKLIRRVEQRGRFGSEDKRKEVVELFRKAQEVYRGR